MSSNTFRSNGIRRMRSAINSGSTVRFQVRGDRGTFGSFVDFRPTEVVRDGGSYTIIGRQGRRKVQFSDASINWAKNVTVVE
jgi:hypothetical protein